MQRNVKVQAALGRMNAAFSGFTAGQRTITAIAVVVAIVGAVVFVSWASKPSMTPLFTGLSSTDASAITAKLAESGTSYELADSGHTVLIPTSDVNQRRIDLAGQGLPSGGEDGEGGYSLIGKETSITTSDKITTLNIKRATEGELQKAIESIDKVSSARVLLAVPENTPFTDEQAKTTASVTVGMRSNATLESSKVEAIVHLVSTAVPKLDPAQVTVIDTKGRLMNTPGAAGAGSADARLAQAQVYSAGITQKIQAMLDKVIGPGNATVNVQAELNFDNTQIDQQEYLQGKPEDKPLYQEQSSETLNGAGNVPQGGVLGPDSTLVPSGNSKSTQKYTASKTKANNAVGQRRTVTTPATGGVKRMSVAVMVNSKSAGAVNIGAIREQVTTAAGALLPRDSVAVTKVPFDTTAAEAAAQAVLDEAAQQRQDELLGLGKNLLLGLLLLAALLIGFRKSRKQSATVDLGELPSVDLDHPALLALPANAGPQPLAYDLDDELPAIAAPEVDPQAAARVHARLEIGALVDENPDEVARLLRGWIAERS